MKEIDINEQKKIMLNILKYVDDFCLNNKINYYLVGGTLIGAIRHKGYIPWDDDIDIALFREDYNKFVTTFNENDNSVYKVLTLDIDKDYYLPYAKVIDTRTLLKENVNGICEIGVNIDVFPLDYISQSSFNNASKIYKINLLDKLICWKTTNIREGRKWYKNLFICFLRLIIPFSYRDLSIKIKEKRSKYIEENDTGLITNLFGAWGAKEITKTKNFSSCIRVPFEDIIASIPVGYDEYLTHLYGDYMKLPPIEKQNSHHEFIAYWK